MKHLTRELREKRRGQWPKFKKRGWPSIFACLNVFGVLSFFKSDFQNIFPGQLRPIFQFVIEEHMKSCFYIVSMIYDWIYMHFLTWNSVTFRHFRENWDRSENSSKNRKIRHSMRSIAVIISKACLANRRQFGIRWCICFRAWSWLSIGNGRIYGLQSYARSIRGFVELWTSERWPPVSVSASSNALWNRKWGRGY